MTITALRLVITGRVQGVGYRAWFAGNARQLDLTGWVRNRTDGTVEAVICGTAEAIAQLKCDCAEGPLPAKVISVETHAWEGEIPILFQQMPTV